MVACAEAGAERAEQGVAGDLADLVLPATTAAPGSGDRKVPAGR